MNKFYKGAALLLLSAFGFSLLPIFALYAYKGHISIATLLIIRFTCGSAIFFAIALIKLKKITVNKKDILYLFVLGGICYNLQAQFYFSSVKYISASLAALFLYTYPIIVTLLSFLVDKEKMAKEVVLSIFVSFTGLILILGTSLKSLNGLGVILALGSAFVYSTYIVISNRVVKRLPPIVMSAFIAMFSCMGVLVSGLFAHSISFSFDASVWLPVLGLILFSTVIAMLFFFLGMELVGPAKASIISMMEPVFTAGLSAVLFHDRLTVTQMIGGLLVLGGAVLVIWSKEKIKTEMVE